jgi:hypothetical protein
MSATKPAPFTVDDLNRLETARKTSRQLNDNFETEALLDLAVVFRNALREIQSNGNHEDKEVATVALNHGKKT